MLRRSQWRARSWGLLNSVFQKNKGRYHYSTIRKKKVDSNPERKLNFGFIMEKKLFLIEDIWIQCLTGGGDEFL